MVRPAFRRNQRERRRMNQRREKKKNGNAEAVSIEVTEGLQCVSAKRDYTGHGLAHRRSLVIRWRSRAPMFLTTVVPAINQHALADRLIHAAMGTGNHALRLRATPLLSLCQTRNGNPQIATRRHQTTQKRSEISWDSAANNRESITETLSRNLLATRIGSGRDRP